MAEQPTAHHQLHVREIADFTSDGSRVITRKYVPLNDYERLLALLREVDIELAHCHVFVHSREKIHPDGLKLYEDLQIKIILEINKVGGAT
jgi:hypothetical protein